MVTAVIPSVIIFQPILQPHPLECDDRLLSWKNPKPTSVILPLLRFDILYLRVCKWYLVFGIFDIWDSESEWTSVVLPLLRFDILDGVFGIWDCVNGI